MYHCCSTFGPVETKVIDEFHLFVNPVALGRGEAIFDRLNTFKNLVLKKSIVYDCGIVLMHYEPK